MRGGITHSRPHSSTHSITSSQRHIFEGCLPTDRHALVGRAKNNSIHCCYPQGPGHTSGGIGFDSYIVPTADLESGGLRLLEVDNPLIIPIETEVRVLVTADDVLHSFAVPALSVKTALSPAVESCAGPSTFGGVTVVIVEGEEGEGRGEGRGEGLVPSCSEVVCETQAVYSAFGGVSFGGGRGGGGGGGVSVVVGGGGELVPARTAGGEAEAAAVPTGASKPSEVAYRYGRTPLVSKTI